MIIGEVVANIKGNSSQLQLEFMKVKKDGLSVSEGVKSQFKKLEPTFRSVGMSLKKYITVPLTLLGGKMIYTATTFEKELTKIQSLVGLTADEVNGFRDSVMDLANETARAPNELAEALFFVTSAGLRGAEALDVLERSAKASASGLGETKVIADLVTSAMNAYGSEVLDASTATNILVGAVREGKAEASEIANSMGQVLPIASELGLGFDEVGASIATMTRTGTDSATAVTQLRQILSSILKPTSEAEKTLNEYGLSAEQLRRTIKEDGLIATLIALRETFKGNDEAMSAIFGNIRALSGVLDIVGANAEENIKIFERLKDTTGLLDDAFEITSETTAFKFAQALASLKVNLTEFGNILLPVVNKVLNFVVSITQAINNLDVEAKKIIIIFGAVLASLGPLLFMIGSMTKSLFLLKVGFMALISPIGLIAIAISTTVGLIIYYWNDLVNYFTGGDGSQVFENFKNYIYDTFTAISNIFKGYARIYSRIFSVLFSALSSTVNTGLNIIFNSIRTIFLNITDFLIIWGSLLEGDFGKVWTAIQRIFARSLNTITNTLLSFVSGTIRALSEFYVFLGRLIPLYRTVGEYGLELADSIDKLKDVFKITVPEYKATGIEASKLEDEFEELDDTVNILKPSLEGLNKTVQNTKNSLSGVRTEIEKFKDVIIDDEIDEFNTNILTISSATDILTTTLKGATTSLNEMYSVLSFLREELNNTFSEEERQQILSLIQGFEEITREMKTLKDNTTETSYLMEGLKDLSNEFVTSLANGLSRAVTEGGKLINVLKNIGKQFMDKAFQMGINFLLTGSFGGGAIVGGLFGALGFSKDGGTAMKGKPKIVGEGGGMELFIPNTTGTIVPNRVLKKAFDIDNLVPNSISNIRTENNIYINLESKLIPILNYDGLAIKLEKANQNLKNNGWI